MYLAQKFFIGDTIFLPLLLESETGPPFYRVIRAIWRFSLKQLLWNPHFSVTLRPLSISLTLEIEPDLPFCSSNRAIPGTVVLIPVISSWQLAILLF